MRGVFRRTPPVFSAKVQGDEAEVLIYDEIGFWGIRAKDVVEELKAIEASTINLRINSPGGDVTEGIAIYNALRNHGATIVTHIDALAASIASIIALAGDPVHMAENAFLMIHDAFAITIGNAELHRKNAGVLDRMNATLIKTYRAKTGASEERVMQWMAAETWFTADEAKDAGFVDEVEGTTEAEANFDLSVFRHPPARLAACATTEPVKRDVERTLRDAGMSRSEAKRFVAAGSKAVTQRDAVVDGGFASECRKLIATLTPQGV
jgi:ATP-dependent protease ClpP protease subunit